MIDIKDIAVKNNHPAATNIPPHIHHIIIESSFPSKPSHKQQIQISVKHPNDKHDRNNEFSLVGLQSPQKSSSDCSFAMIGLV